MRSWTEPFKSFLNLFLAPKCSLCQRPAKVELCQYCHRQLQLCQFNNGAQFWQGKLPVFVWGMYGGVLKRAIATLKYENQPQLARPLGQLLGQAWVNSSLSSPSLTVVPIPLHSAKLQQRGYNQADLLAESFCQFVRLPCQPQGLERVRSTEAQFGLSPTARSQNLADAFCLGKGFRQRLTAGPVLLLDDIYTTGATVRSAAQTLLQAGIKVYGVVAIASTQRG